MDSVRSVIVDNRRPTSRKTAPIGPSEALLRLWLALLGGGVAAAALTMPYLSKLAEPDRIDAAAAAVQAAAQRISDQLVDDDHHP